MLIIQASEHERDQRQRDHALRERIANLQHLYKLGDERLEVAVDELQFFADGMAIAPELYRAEAQAMVETMERLLFPHAFH